MAEEKKSGSRIGGWIKAFAGMIGGVISTALVMYLTPVFEKAVSPAKPLANFDKQQAGFNITLQNRAVGAASGWWDFGDGTALEPFDPHQDSVAHKYENPGDYTIKLSVHNLIGDANERVVQLHIDKEMLAAPEISDLDVIPVSSYPYAPATYRITAKIQNAQLYVWDMGDDRPLEILNDSTTNQDRMVTFKKTGSFVVKLAARNGDHVTEKSEIVNIIEPPANAIVAELVVTDDATEVQTIRVEQKLAAMFEAGNKSATSKFDRQYPAQQGYEIVDIIPKGTQGLQGKTELAIDAKLAGIANAKDLRVKLESDHKSLRFTGELDRHTNSTTLPSIAVPVTLVLQKKVPTSKPSAVSGHLIAGSAVLALPPTPANWVDVHRQVSLRLKDGETVLLDQPQLLKRSGVNIRNHNCVLTATPQGDQVRLDLVEVSRVTPGTD